MPWLWFTFWAVNGKGDHNMGRVWLTLSQLLHFVFVEPMFELDGAFCSLIRLAGHGCGEQEAKAEKPVAHPQEREKENEENVEPAKWQKESDGTHMRQSSFVPATKRKPGTDADVTLDQ